MTSVGIQRFGGYVPRRRLQRSVIAESNAWFNPGLKRFGAGERAIASWDEDAVTMAVEAARDALGKVARDSVRGVYLASTSLPFLDRQNAVGRLALLDRREDRLEALSRQEISRRLESQRRRLGVGALLPLIRDTHHHRIPAPR